MRHTVSRYVREKFKRMLVKSSSLFCAPLSREETRNLPFLEAVSGTERYELRELCVNGERFKPDMAVVYPETFLFRVTCEEDGSLGLLPSGGIYSGDRLLASGFRQDYNILGYLQSLGMHKEPLAGTVIAPCPHRFLTYGDFVMQLLPELCLIKSSLDEEEWRNARIILPRPPRFVVDYLVLLGCTPSQIVDSTKCTFQLQAGSRVYFREKDPFCALPELVRLTREYLVPSSRGSGGSVLFIERHGSYRNAIGLGKEMRLRLEGAGVSFYDAPAFSIEEQINAFANARLVVGVHGSGLANILWCQPGTRMIEVFHPKYTPLWDALLAHYVGIDYYCLGGKPGWFDIRYRELDVAVDWQQLISLIARLLQDSP